jgi:hypothetical protein
LCASKDRFNIYDFLAKGKKVLLCAIVDIKTPAGES